MPKKYDLRVRADTFNYPKEKMYRTPLISPTFTSMV